MTRTVKAFQNLQGPINPLLHLIPEQSQWGAAEPGSAASESEAVSILDSLATHRRANTQEKYTINRKHTARAVIWTKAPSQLLDKTRY